MKIILEPSELEDEALKKFFEQVAWGSKFYGGIQWEREGNLNIAVTVPDKYVREFILVFGQWLNTLD